ncbi:MAG: class I SAM-dependent methyltransferase [Hyphomonadaceae bacterium]|nr:class I SAM-dependent methyltransferase [Hyphomonadaceae bacterium]
MPYARSRRLIELLAIDQPWVGELFVRRARKRNGHARDEAHWDQLYAEGEYDRLWRNDQRYHQRLLASLISARRPHPALLDIGCGEGAFYDSLRQHAPSSYLGVDISNRAIERAKARFGDAAAPGPVRFEQGDAARFAVTETFDAIVFSECVEYFDDIESVVAHYRRSLRPGGIIGLTSWLAVRQLRIWRKLKTIATVEDESVVFSQWGGAWIVAVLSPK